MPITAQLVYKVRRGNMRAAAEVLSDCYPLVNRLAYGISGRDDVGDGIVRFVMRQGLRQIEHWEDENAPLRWCRHHTILAARRAAKHQPTIAGDALVKHARTNNTYYAGFIRALRALPIQQKEAFLLHHAEQLDTRDMATTMDCSTEAATNHLKEATKTLTALGGEHYASFTAQLAHAYRSLEPPRELVLSNMRARVRRYFLPRKVFAAVKFIALCALLGIIGYLIYLSPKIVF